jgi:hypothetical protein
LNITEKWGVKIRQNIEKTENILLVIAKSLRDEAYLLPQSFPERFNEVTSEQEV